PCSARWPARPRRSRPWTRLRNRQPAHQQNGGEVNPRRFPINDGSLCRRRFEKIRAAPASTKNGNPKMAFIEKFGPVIGRILIALLFIPAGFGKIGGFEGTVGYIASKGIPLPQVAAAGTIFVE